MPRTFEFRCHGCSEQHTGLPAWHFAEPAQLHNVPVDVRDARVDLTEDGCTIDDREFYVKGLLEIPVRDTGDAFTWGVWLSLSERSFERYCVLFKDERRPAGESFFGWLCDRVPGYPDTLLLKTRLHGREYPNRPLVELEPTDHRLAVDQREGISAERAAAMAEQLLHPAEP
jgi:hypothetical protein